MESFGWASEHSGGDPDLVSIVLFPWHPWPRCQDQSKAGSHTNRTIKKDHDHNHGVQLGCQEKFCYRGHGQNLCAGRTKVLAIRIPEICSPIFRMNCSGQSKKDEGRRRRQERENRIEVYYRAGGEVGAYDVRMMMHRYLVWKLLHQHIRV